MYHPLTIENTSQAQTSGEAQFKQIIDKMLETYIAKNHDYGDSFAKGCDKYGIVSAISRIDEKMDRVNTLYPNAEIAKVNESIEDTLLDMANYCVMLVMYLHNHKI